MFRRARSVNLRPLATGLALLLVAAALVLARPDPASAAVTHLLGFRATVDGFTSWYGSYAMGDLGTAWCIDHGIRSPDPDYRYAPADLSAVPAEVQSAMAWAVATHGRGDDRVTHAALMLALHDLMGAQYPSGRLDVDRLTITRLAGFGGAEGQVLSLARSIKADGLAHRGLRGPLRLTLEIGPIDAAGSAPVTAQVADAGGQGVSGVALSFEGSSAALSAPSATTGAQGAVALTVRAGGAPTTVEVTATVPHLPLEAWAPTTIRAQRVARPTVDRITASGSVDMTQPVTTTTTTPPTTTPPTTAVPTTTPPTTAVPPTTAPPTTVPAPTRAAAPTSPPATAPPTTTPPTTTPPTTTPPTTAVPIAAPPTTAPTAPTAPTLPRTGVDALTLGLFGAGLLLVGRSLLELGGPQPTGARPTCAQPSAPRSRRSVMRASS